jgi:hypothetical protein
VKRAASQEKALVLLLRVCGGVTLLALPAVFLPTEWMAAIHRAAGLGEFPASPLVDYLTRSVSAVYAIQGGLMILVSGDLRRHARVIGYLAITGIAFGILVLGIDLHAGLPWRWALCEGPPIVVIGLSILFLMRRVKRTGDESGPGAGEP